jgi:hypothetical protein
MKKYTNYSPAFEVIDNSRNVFDSCLKRVFTVFDFIATNTGRNAIVFSCSSPALKRNEVFKNLKPSAAISAPLAEVVKRFNPFLNGKRFGKFVFSCSPSFVANPLELGPKFFVLLAFVAKSVFRVALRRKKQDAATQAGSLAFLKHCLSALGMIVPNQKTRNIVKPEPNHPICSLVVLAVYTLLPLVILPAVVYNQLHCSPQRKSPFATRASASQRGEVIVSEKYLLAQVIPLTSLYHN